MNRGFSERTERNLRVVGGLFGVVVSTMIAIEPHGNYLPGDIRNGPLFWPIIGLLFGAASVILILSTFYKRLR